MTSHKAPAPTAPRPYITCREVLAFLMAYLDGELTSEQSHEFDRHLSVCASCVNYVNTYKETVRLGKASMTTAGQPAGDSVPEDLIKAIRAARLKGG